MRRFFELTVNEMRRNLYILKNYKFAFFTNIISNFIFIAIFFSVITALFDFNQGFMMILWPIMIALIGAGGDNIKGDMQLGTLERLVSDNKSFKKLLLARIIADGIWTVPIVIVTGLVFAYLSKDGANVLFQIILVFIPLLICSLGLGLFVSGLTFYHKDTGSTVNIITLLLMACTVLPWNDWFDSFAYLGALIVPFVSLNIFSQNQEMPFLILAIVNSVLVFIFGNKLFGKYFKLTKQEKGFIRY